MSFTPLPAPHSPDGDKYRAKIASLIERYGDGVRPGWVSDEIAMNELWAEAADREAFRNSFKASNNKPTEVG